jgi:CO/xanthine dehydrogenase FAD-binding subunit
MAAGARPVAGGTDLVVGARQGKATLPESLVAIHRLDELRGIEEADGGLRIGALTSHADLAAHPVVRGRFTALADAAAIVGSHATRAFGTLGGNLMNASPAAETAGPLICFGATVTLRGSSGTRDVPVSELFEGPGSTTAEPGELLVSVTIPAPADGTGSCYARLEYRRQMEIAVVGATAVVTGSGSEVTGAKVAITALAPTIRLVPEAEAALVGDGGAEQAATAAAAAAAPISDVRASADYRRAMAAVIARRTIEAALARARGEDVPIPASQSLYGGMS